MMGFGSKFFTHDEEQQEQKRLRDMREAIDAAMKLNDEQRPQQAAAADQDAQPAPQTSTSLAVAPDNKDATRAFLQACHDNDPKEATRIAMENDIEPAYLKKGLKTLVVEHQNYQDTGALLVKSGVADATYMASRVDADFVKDVLRQSKDPMGAVLYLNGLGATYSTENFLQASISGPDTAIQVIQSGNFDPKQDNSRSLLYAAGSGQKEVFNELMKAGADPMAAINAGSNDPRWGGTYEKLATWAQDFYKEHPEMEPKKSAASGPDLKASASMKEFRLAP